MKTDERRDGIWVRLYRAALRLMPEEVRTDAVTEMVEIFRLALAARPNPVSRFGLIVCTGLDLVTTTLWAWAPSTRGHSTISNALRGASRSIRRSPGLSAVVAVTLAVAIGSVTTTFSVVNGVLLTPIRLDRPHEVVTIWGRSNVADLHPLAPSDLYLLKSEANAFQVVAGRWTNTETLQLPTFPQQVQVAYATTDYMGLLGIEPAVGRLFGEGEEDAVLVDHAFWTAHFGADPGVVGQQLRLGDDVVEIIGVLPADRDPEMPTVGGVREANDIWRAMPAGYMGDDWDTRWIRGVGRLRPGVSLVDVQSDLARVSSMAHTLNSERANIGFQYYATPVLEELVRGVRPTLIGLLAAVAMVLLVACVNVANLLVVRAEKHQHELAVRRVLGAGRVDLATQAAFEALLLAIAGGAGGVAVALAGVSFVRQYGPTVLPRMEMVSIDPTVLFCAGATTSLVALIALSAPVRFAVRVPPWKAFTSRGASASRGRTRWLDAFVGVQVASSVTLMALVVLSLKSTRATASVPIGFESGGTLTALYSTGRDFDGREERIPYQLQLLATIRDRPDVSAAALSNLVPLGGGMLTEVYSTGTEAVPAGQLPTASIRFITTDYFEAMGTALIRGRAFTDDDEVGAAIVDRNLAAIAWPGLDPLGQSLSVDAEELVVVGVVEHMRHAELTRDGTPTIFLPWATGGGGGRVFISVQERPAAQITREELRQTVAAADPLGAISDVQRMRDRVSDATATQRMALHFATFFGLVASVLSGLGLHTVITYWVARRRREIGTRLALGAQRREVVAHVWTIALRLVFIGAAVGTVTALFTNRMVSTYMFGVEAVEPISLLGALLFVGVASTLSILGPVIRAANVSAVEALRVT